MFHSLWCARQISHAILINHYDGLLHLAYFYVHASKKPPNSTCHTITILHSSRDNYSQLTNYWSSTNHWSCISSTSTVLYYFLCSFKSVVQRFVYVRMCARHARPYHFQDRCCGRAIIERALSAYLFVVPFFCSSFNNSLQEQRKLWTVLNITAAY